MNHLIRLSLLLGLSFLFSGFSPPGDKYARKIERHRKKIHKEFLDPEESPLKGDDLAHFEGLAFYPPDENYRVVADFERTADAAPFMLPTSNPEKPKKYVKYGILRFELNGEPHELSVYRSLRLAEIRKYKDYLFLPFKDASNGNGSYGGGRYIDLKIPKGDKIILDFNLCYNPYCAYSDGWSCPIPPDENHLNISIPAGVKDWKGH
jgi:uncharacterized protein (DUF1684 family)